MIDRAYALAYFILRRQDLALRATEDALGRLDVAMASQDKRLYYDRTRREPESSRRQGLAGRGAPAPAPDLHRLRAL